MVSSRDVFQHPNLHPSVTSHAANLMAKHLTPVGQSGSALWHLEMVLPSTEGRVLLRAQESGDREASSCQLGSLMGLGLLYSLTPLLSALPMSLSRTEFPAPILISGRGTDLFPMTGNGSRGWVPPWANMADNLSYVSFLPAHLLALLILVRIGDASSVPIQLLFSLTQGPYLSADTGIFLHTLSPNRTTPRIQLPCSLLPVPTRTDPFL